MRADVLLVQCDIVCLEFRPSGWYAVVDEDVLQVTNSDLPALRIEVWLQMGEFIHGRRLAIDGLQVAAT